MKWSGKSVLVTGAGGFIGSHLTEALAKRGARTKAFVHYNALGNCGWLDDSPFKKRIEIVAGDIRDRSTIEQAMKDVDIVFHLAALIAIPYSYQTPESYVSTNIGGTLNILQAARRLKPERIIFTSTSEVYGTARYVPIDENHPLQAQSPYSASKIGADKLVEAFCRSFNLPAVTVRPFNTFGPRQSARAIVPTIIIQCLTGKTVRLGNHYPVRDLNYVSDVVEGFLLAAHSKKVMGRTINLGSGTIIRIYDLAKLIAKLMNKRITIVSDSRRIRPSASEVECLQADHRLARELTGWEPRYSLEEGLRLTTRWMKKHPERYGSNLYAV